MKRALRIFGNRLGNCAYDKMFLKEVKSRPAGSTNNLMRAANYPIKPPTVQKAPAAILQPIPLQPQQQLQQPQMQEIIFDDSVFDNSMMISEEDLVIDESAFMVEDENSVTIGNANATFPSAGIYPLPPRVLKK